MSEPQVNTSVPGECPGQLRAFSVARLEEISLQNPEAAKQYIRDYFVNTLGRGIYFYNVDGVRWEPVFEASLKQWLPRGIKIFESKAGKQVKAIDWLQDYDFDRYKVLSNISAPITDRENKAINTMAKPLFHHSVELDTPCDDPEVNQGCDRWFQHFREVWADGNDTVYEYILNWFACTIAGIKVKVALYCQSGQQYGKNIPLEFIERHVLGEELVLIEDNMETIEKYTARLEGRMLVTLNEMPCSSTGQWRAIENRCKSLITESSFNSREMYSRTVKAPNCFNICILTNNDAIHISGENASTRWRMLDISDRYVNNSEYFVSLGKCFTRDIGKEFYRRMMLRAREKGQWFQSIGFREQLNTTTLHRKIADSMPKVYCYLKEQYLMDGAGIDIEFQQLLRDLNESGICIKSGKLQTFLHQLKCFAVTADGKFKRRINQDKRKVAYVTCSFSDLYAVYEKRKWILDTDDIVAPDPADETGAIDHVKQHLLKISSSEGDIEPESEVESTSSDASSDSELDRGVKDSPFESVTDANDKCTVSFGL